MKKAITFFLIACCLLPLTGCSKDQVLGRYNEVLQAAGEATLTGSGDLEGERSFGADHYVGSYAADYEGFSGEEVLFGGTALEREGGDELSVSCKTESDAGTVRLVFQSGAEEPEILCDTAGMYTGTIQLPAASNYIIVEMENFTGSLDLTIE